VRAAQVANAPTVLVIVAHEVPTSSTDGAEARSRRRALGRGPERPLERRRSFAQRL